MDILFLSFVDLQKEANKGIIFYSLLLGFFA